MMLGRRYLDADGKPFIENPKNSGTFVTKKNWNLWRCVVCKNPVVFADRWRCKNPRCYMMFYPYSPE